MQQRFVFRSPEDGKGGGGGGGAEAQIAALTKSIGILASGMRELQEAYKTQSATLAKLAEPGEKPKSGGSADLTDPNLDLDQLDRKEFMALLLSRFDERLSDVVGGVKKEYDERLSTVSNSFHDDVASRELTNISGKHKDFYEWREEVQSLLKATPGLTLARAYTIARTENPEKAQELDKKYNPPEPKQEFLGLTPTSGLPVDSDGPKNLTEAQNRAWEKVSRTMGIPSDILPH